MSKGAALTLDIRMCLRRSKLYNNNLSSGAAGCLLPSVFVTVATLCTLANALKVRQTEYYTNTHLRRPSTVPCPSHPRRYTFLQLTLHPPVLVSFLCRGLLSYERTPMLACGCFVFAETRRGSETCTYLRDLAV